MKTLSISSILILLSIVVIAQDKTTLMIPLEKKGFVIEEIKVMRPYGYQIYGKEFIAIPYIGCYRSPRCYLPKTPITEVSVRTSGLSAQYFEKQEGDLQLRDLKAFTLQSSRWRHSYYSLKPKYNYFGR